MGNSPCSPSPPSTPLLFGNFVDSSTDPTFHLPPPPSCLTASLSLSASFAAQLLLTHFFSLPLSPLLSLSLSQLEHFNYALMAHNSQFPIRQLLQITPPPFRSTPLPSWLQFPSLRCLRLRTSLAKATSFYSSPPPLSLSRSSPSFLPLSTLSAPALASPQLWLFL